MHLRSKILGLLLSAALVMATLATSARAEVDHASASSKAGGEVPAGCHGHGGTALSDSHLPDSRLPHSPLPSPVNYQCCLTGHDAAAVQASHFAQPSARSTRIRSVHGSLCRPAWYYSPANLVSSSATVSPRKPCLDKPRFFGGCLAVAYDPLSRTFYL